MRSGSCCLVIWRTSVALLQLSKKMTLSNTVILSPPPPTRVSEGLRSGMIFYRKGSKSTKIGQPEGVVYDYEDKIGFAVFPSLQGGPHNHQITALVALKQAMSPGFEAYAKRVKANAVALGENFKRKEYKIVTDGTENHLVLWDLRPLGLTDNKVEKLCDLANITMNKNDVFW